MLRGMLLDIDGTLLLSNEAHARAWVDAYREFGYHVQLARVRPLIGMGGDKLMKRLTPELDSSAGTGKQIADRRQEIFFQRYAPTLEPAPGARALLLRLKADGLTLTIATSAKDRELGVLLKAAGIADLVEEKTTSDDAKESKPDPDIVHAALVKSRLSANEVLMLGDTPYDVESAGKLGVGVIAMRCGGHSDEDLRGAIAIYDDPADLLAHFDSSPIAKMEQVPLQRPAVR